MNFSNVITLTILLIACSGASPRNALCKERQQPLIFLWWNVENLFDTKNDPGVDDDEFTPEGKRQWTEKKLLLKRLRIAQVFKAIRADREYGKYPDIVAFAETENRQVFAGTLSAINRAGYAIDYCESPDPRGIDIGLAWNPATVKFTGSKPCTVRLDNGRGTRLVIVAGFIASGRPFSVVLNHWPSRAFDAGWSEKHRIAAARVTRRIVDSLRTRDPLAEVIVMGDLNDHPADRSVRETLGSSLDRKAVRHSGGRLLYNCWNGAASPGSYFYKNRWERIDHMLVSAGLLDGKGLSIGKGAFRVFSIPEMFDRSGKGLYQTYAKGKFKGGYSDHLPLLLKIGLTH
ncbi:endonuclease [Chlorobaculum limnaeum]|uniref:Endonuclease n=1 Tax=Chlorobaculum limnaeum TaxID=274537 RepID=A0A1D8CXA9_CHLLM|nr:endonuclease/exonuclease/phosphatase family protein [Chlorobaculum limnaeum]AOS83566.1 endonuclease [Chlorobaculum limnaeum]